MLALYKHWAGKRRAHAANETCPPQLAKIECLFPLTHGHDGRKSPSNTLNRIIRSQLSRKMKDV